jgi:hypothetical protein
MEEQAVAELRSRLMPEAQRDLAASQWKVEGYEIAQRILRPLSEGRGPLQRDNITSEARRAVSNRASLEALLAHRVSLLGGYSVQDLGVEIDWFRAPREDWQWTTHLSRHYWLKPLAFAWRETKDPRYSQEVVAVLRDWLQKVPFGVPSLRWHNRAAAEADIPASLEGSFHKIGDGPWTSLSAHARVDTWTELFQLIWDAPALNNGSAAVLLNSLLGDHRILMLNHDRRGTANQYMALARSLVGLGLWYPDFVEVQRAEKKGWERAAHFAKTQIYPDGSTAECSPNYSAGSLRMLFDLYERGTATNRTVPAELRPCIEAGMRYFAAIADPLGRPPRIAKGGGGELRSTVGRINQLVRDPKAAWFASWAGHAVVRSSWDERATWLFFEPGPRGSGHHDLAQLNLQLVSNGDWLLTDPGFYSYAGFGIGPLTEDGKMAKWLHSSAAHNVALVDGEGQIRFPKGGKIEANAKPGVYPWTVDGEVVTTGGIYNYGFGNEGQIRVEHERLLRFDRAADTVEVADTFSGEGKHTVALHWQCDPRAQVAVENTAEGVAVTVRMPNATLKILPQVSNPLAIAKPLTVRVVRGEREPYGGWFSASYGKLEAAPMIIVEHEKATLPLKINTRLAIQKT